MNSLPHEQQSYYGCSSPTSDLEHFLPQSLTDCSEGAIFDHEWA